MLGNNPVDVAQQYPSALKNLDAIMNESVYYSNSQFGPQSANVGFINTLAPIYNSSGLVILGNDYPVLTDYADDLQSFEYYTSMGWVPSVQDLTNNQWEQMYSTGPFMFMAVPKNITVTGSPNLLSWIRFPLTVDRQ